MGISNDETITLSFFHEPMVKGGTRLVHMPIKLDAGIYFLGFNMMKEDAEAFPERYEKEYNKKYTQIRERAFKFISKVSRINKFNDKMEMLESVDQALEAKKQLINSKLVNLN